MLTNHFNYLLKKEIMRFNIIFLIFLTTLKVIYSEVDSLKGTYPNCLLLQNGNLFLTNINGMFIYDINLHNKLKQYAYYNKTIDSNNIGIISSNTIIAQFSEENGMIICLVLNAVYFFNHEGNYLFMDFLPDFNLDYSLLNLLIYKKDNAYFYYIITFTQDVYLYILYYKVNNLKNELIRQEKFKPFYFDYPAIYLNLGPLGCQIMNSQKEGKVLTCCFQTMNPNFIVIQSFIIENNFETIGEEIYSKVESPSASAIRTSVSEDGKKLLTCYRESNEVGYCFIYDIDENTIVRNEPLIKNCNNQIHRFKLFYFNQTREYILICSNVDKDFAIIKMDNTFNILNANKFITYNFRFNYGFNTFNLLYDENQKKYSLILDAWTEVNNLWSYFTGKYNISIDLNSDFSGGTPPNPFTKIIPSTTPIPLPLDNKYYVNTKEFYRPITVNEMNWIIIDFLDRNNPLILTKENKEIRKELYAINIEMFPAGQLKYIINGEEKDIIENTRIFGEFKFKYIPTGKFGDLTTLEYTVYLRNYSVASMKTKYWLVSCKKNCSCISDRGTCDSCAEGYSFYQNYGNCIKGSDICSYKFYTNNSTKFLSCIQKNEDCPPDYPIYNEITKECKQKISHIPFNPYNPNIDAPDSNNIEYSTNNKTNEYKSESSDIYKNNSKSSSLDKSGTNFIDDTTLKNIFNSTKEEFLEKIIDWILGKKNITDLENSEELKQPNKTYKILSNIIKEGNINMSLGNEDIIIKTENITYQITSTQNQKNANQNSDISIIDLGECEKIIKRNISYEDDPTPLIILKIDLKKKELKANDVKYEVYNPYTKEKINLDICSNTKIKIISPVNLTSDESKRYDEVKNQGYDIYDENDSFYQNICTPFTSENGTDVIISDRKDYYYDKNATFCDNSCTYKGINTHNQKVICLCHAKYEIDFENNNFDREKFFENFYKVQDYTNYQVLYCYKLVLSSKGLINNICFFVFIFLFTLFLSSMIVNLLRALKKIDEIIFKIFQDRFMFEIMRNIIKGKKKKKQIEIQLIIKMIKMFLNHQLKQVKI